ncbi:MAG TPA: hypothetical protein VJR94_05095 [Candidatus Nitrosocosmicus sp.]|nr:hypothetical protein [Candidatus Nitrosocosmicus sp.]
MSYHISESPYSIWLDKKEIMLAQIQACENPLSITEDKNEFAVLTRDF